MAGEVMAFTGVKNDRQWIKETMPKGSRLVAHIEMEDPVHKEYPPQYVVFQSEKTGKLSIFFFKDSEEDYDRIEPHAIDKPHKALKSILERAGKGRLSCYIPQAEFQALIGEEAEESEERRKRQEFARIPARLEKMRDTLNVFQERDQVKNIDPREWLHVCYVLTDIADLCSILSMNLLYRLDDGDRDAQLLKALPAWIREALEVEGMKHGRGWKEEANSILSDSLQRLAKVKQ